MIESAIREHVLLRRLLVAAAGSALKWTPDFSRQRDSSAHAFFLYCVSGGGWCEVKGLPHTIRKGDFLALLPGTPHACRPHPSTPWTVHWVRATGEDLPHYFKALGVSLQKPVLHVGEDPQMTRLFHEIFRSLQGGSAFADLLQASQGLAYLLSCLAQQTQSAAPKTSDTVQKIAGAIIYMSEHLDQPLRVAELARLAGLSADYFTQLFKHQTGCSPRDYLHLLRIHKACHLLQTTDLDVKQIAGRLGYQDQFHFSRNFKAFQGLSPTQYRNLPRA